MKNDRIVQEEDLLTLIESKCQFLKEKLSHFSETHFFSVSTVRFDRAIFNNEQLRIGNIMSRRINWTERIDNLFKSGFSVTDINAAITPNKKEDAEYFLVGKIYFNSSSNFGGEIDFIRKFTSGVLNNEYLMCFYTLNFEGKKYKMIEQTADWEEGIRLIALSVNDFEKRPVTFIQDRILKWQQKIKEPL